MKSITTFTLIIGSLTLLALLTQLVKENPQNSSVSIRASAKNPAVRLYERFGFKVVQQSEQAVTMSRKV